LPKKPQLHTGNVPADLITARIQERAQDALRMSRVRRRPALIFRAGWMMLFHSVREGTMAKKRRAPTGGVPASILGSANKIVLAGLGAFSMAQEEGTQLFDTLVQEGTKVFNGLVEGAGAVGGRAVGMADETMAEIKAAAAGTWNALERIVEDRVAGVLQTLNVVTGRDITPARRVARSGGQAKKRKLRAKSRPSRRGRKSRASKRK